MSTEKHAVFSPYCWCDAPASWWTDCGGGAVELCDDHKRESEAMPENAGVEFHRFPESK